MQVIKWLCTQSCATQLLSVEWLFILMNTWWLSVPLGKTSQFTYMCTTEKVRLYVCR